MFGITGVTGTQLVDHRRMSVRISGVDRDCRVAMPAPPPSPAVSRLIDGDAINPGPQIRFAAKLPDALKRSQKRFLSEVASLFRVLGQPIKQTVNLSGALVNQFFKGGRVAALQSFNELIFNRRPSVDYGRRGNLLQFHLPAEGYWLSVAHRLPPGAGIKAVKNCCPFPDRLPFRHQTLSFCSRRNSIGILDAFC